MWIIAQAERDVVEAMTQCKKPDMGGLQQLITPVGEAIQAADKLTQVCPARAVGSRAQHHGSASQRNCSSNPVCILRDSRMPVVATQAPHLLIWAQAPNLCGMGARWRSGDGTRTGAFHPLNLRSVVIRIPRCWLSLAGEAYRRLQSQQGSGRGAPFSELGGVQRPRLW